MLVIGPDPFGQKRIEGFERALLQEKLLMLCFETREEGFDDGILLRTAKAVRSSLSFLKQEMTDPHIRRSGGDPDRKRWRGFKHPPSSMVQNRQKPNFPAAIDELGEIGGEPLEGVRFPCEEDDGPAFR
ncbi:hypothetical protein [Hydrogenibacillus schlegelii]|uniref:hypothetical protein n=1 Tax=Hydrogenibacillus schlegelii TaxID=1484 RepID=UPI002352E6F1|nr:hypothetical protein [Hydrogenibacillus schlegelii]